MALLLEGVSSTVEGVLQRGEENIKTNYFVFEDGALWQMHLGSFNAKAVAYFEAQHKNTMELLAFLQGILCSCICMLLINTFPFVAT